MSEVSVRFSGFFTILSFDANPGFETADLAVGPTNYTLTDTIFGTSGYDPPSNPAGSTATIERTVGPFGEFDGTSGGSNRNGSPIITDFPDDGPNSAWGDGDDNYRNLTPEEYDPGPGEPPGAPEGLLIDRGNAAVLPADALDLDGNGDTTEILSLDANGRQRISGAAPDSGAYERQ